MKGTVLRLAASAALVFGLGFGASAFAADPDCVGVCAELRGDCIAQAGPHGSTAHCRTAYRDCIAGCSL